ncbi:transcriptional repressor LexA [Peptostreptococcus faecalis]|uniref:transcriptional repressor LexA n=1 Tax=Peptostreptococcus faecalis TaxID=2045015 RepID=UPI000C7C270A|nr:transcriptional repressor LexA [Peptostreptococcus faecalis]
MYEDLNNKEITVLKFLKEHTGEKGYPPSVREICKALDIKSTSTVFSLLNSLEKNKYIRKDPTKPRAIEILDKNFEDSPSNSFDTEILNIPVVGRIAAGQPIFAEENIEEHLPLPASHVKGNNCFVLRVEGDSMVEAGIFHRDYIVVDSSNIAPPNGKIVVALIDEDTSTVKTLQKTDNQIILKPENSLYDPMIFSPEQVKIIGVVTGVFRVL